MLINENLINLLICSSCCLPSVGFGFGFDFDFSIEFNCKKKKQKVRGVKKTYSKYKTQMTKHQLKRWNAWGTQSWALLDLIDK